MNSIRTNLVRSLSVSLSLILALVMLTIDVVIDRWVDNEFETVLLNKASLLVTLVEEYKHGLEFEFSGEFMPEFERSENPEYFQVWIEDRVFERSHSLSYFQQKDLPFKDVNGNKKNIFDIVLPDGRDGRIIYYSFKPQVDTSYRKEFYSNLEQKGIEQKTMTLAYAASIQKTENILLFLDALFVFATIFVVFIVVHVVKRKVDKGLNPLNKLNSELKKISISDTNLQLSHHDLSTELLPVMDSINSFIDKNKALYQKEKRLTSDIAHELKTPITELISLTEVTMKFPKDNFDRLNYQHEVLSISYRLKNIISNILLLNKVNDTGLPKNDIFDYGQVTTAICDRYANENIQTAIYCELDPVENNLFAIEMVLTNLINNALEHSPKGSAVNVSFNEIDGCAVISISNQLVDVLLPEDLERMFEPMWQKDSSRTSTEHFGLGLTIVASLCKAIDADITVSAIGHIITFKVTFN